ncbi:MAG: branched-chain-amino-acid transaminase [Candidatus Sumerlaeia bacterium]|nr:branched-chain-amino-acid transaminase [Candidatus Sumerlaeia bacterium]
MSLTIYLDGQYLSREDAKISVFDHAILYGDGVFEGTRVYSGNIFRLGQHLDRLYDSAKAILLRIPVERAALEAAHVETVRRNGFKDCYIRTVVTRGVGDLGIDPKKSKESSLFIIADKIALYPAELYSTGIAVVTASTRRVGPDNFSPRVKSLNYLNNVLAKIEANNAGANDALMLDRNGYIVEATAANVFTVKDGLLRTPPLYQGALPGITRRTVLEIAAALGIAHREERLTQYDCYVADEMFLTGTGAEIMPVTKLDGRVIGNGSAGPVMKRLLEDFRRRVLVEGVRAD